MTLSPESVAKAEAWKSKLNLKGRKLVFIQSSGRTNPKVFSFFKWSYWLYQLRDEFCFVQIGNLRDQFLWTEHFMLKQWRIDEMAALLSIGDAFVGPNSGVMHLASAVRTRTVVMHNEAKSSEMVFPTLSDNERLPGHVNHHLYHCYPWHYHLVTEPFHDSRSRFAELATFENFKAVLREACVQPNPRWTSMKHHFNLPTRQML
jgi:ADP-heptose:LPS heptosyltransferase